MTKRRCGCYRQAIMVLRWFLDGTRVARLALDNEVSGSTAYRYVHERCVAGRAGRRI
jgi:hypothetical protein